MNTGQRAFGQAAASLGTGFDLPSGGRRSEGARLRLLLAVAGLAALVAWGALSHVGTETATNPRGATSAEDAVRYDGRGKWTGYTSAWRSRPQILRDAGVTPDR